MQQGMRDAAAKHEATVAAHDEEPASAPSAEVEEGGATEGAVAVEDKAKGTDPTPSGAAPTGPPSKKCDSPAPLDPELQQVLGRRAQNAAVLQDSSMTLKCAKVSPHKSAIWDSTLGYPDEGPGTPRVPSSQPHKI